MSKMRGSGNRIIAWIFTLVLIGFFLYALGVDNQFRFDSAVMLVLLWGVYFARRRLNLYEFHFFLFGIFLCLHNLGAFGAYGLTPLGIEFDYWVHGYFGLVSALILFRAFRNGSGKGLNNSRIFVYIAVIAIVLGFSAGHEIVEYLGAITLGEGEGFLFIGVGDQDRFDTQKDMLNNLIGSALGLAVYWFYSTVHREG